MEWSSGPIAVLQGLALGLSLAAPPGPVNALIARESAHRGTLAGVKAGLPAPIVDTGYLLLVLFGVSQVVDVASWLPVLSALGAILLGYLAWETVRIRDEARRTALSGPWSVWIVTLTNPFQYAWWLSAGTAFVAITGLWGVTGFLAAIFGWVLLFSFLVAHGASRWSWFTAALEILSADLLFLFAVRLAWMALPWLAGLVAAAGL
jgi:threonine/homoserine/homoserine lactone efflux protein